MRQLDQLHYLFLTYSILLILLVAVTGFFLFRRRNTLLIQARGISGVILCPAFGFLSGISFCLHVAFDGKCYSSIKIYWLFLHISISLAIEKAASLYFRFFAAKEAQKLYNIVKQANNLEEEIILSEKEKSKPMFSGMRKQMRLINRRKLFDSSFFSISKASFFIFGCLLSIPALLYNHNISDSNGDFSAGSVLCRYDFWRLTKLYIPLFVYSIVFYVVLAYKISVVKEKLYLKKEIYFAMLNLSVVLCYTFFYIYIESLGNSIISMSIFGFITPVLIIISNSSYSALKSGKVDYSKSLSNTSDRRNNREEILNDLPRFLRKTISNSISRDAFEGFLIEEFSAESLYFFETIDDFIKEAQDYEGSSYDDRVIIFQKAFEIYMLYISDDAEFPVNIPPNYKCSLEEILGVGESSRGFFHRRSLSKSIKLKTFSTMEEDPYCDEKLVKITQILKEAQNEVFLLMCFDGFRRYVLNNSMEMSALNCKTISTHSVEK